VRRQPAAGRERELAALALVACPTGSIGAHGVRRDFARAELSAATAAYPRELAPGVFHCGFHDEATFGATSWLLRRPDGNVLVDVPRFSEPLVRRIEALGGARLLFLTHCDDVGDHARFAARLGCQRVLHEGDVEEGTRAVERLLRGRDPVALAPDLLAIPTPGHTRGSACLLARETFLFSGDHVAWSDELGHPYAFRDVTWHDWDELVESMRRLAKLRFEWILPGHGAPGHLPAPAMREAMQRCLEWLAREGSVGTP
jgi:glyoxylase-like metal-dependent hydrolase (beta-lactamase superfamily II)